MTINDSSKFKKKSLVKVRFLTIIRSPFFSFLNRHQRKNVTHNFFLLRKHELHLGQVSISKANDYTLPTDKTCSEVKVILNLKSCIFLYIFNKPFNAVKFRLDKLLNSLLKKEYNSSIYFKAYIHSCSHG